MKEQRSAIMDQILTPEAKNRLTNIAVVKPEKAEKLEQIII
jgi:DNA-binding TFAR19-related protein (PDSD5 family)